MASFGDSSHDAACTRIYQGVLVFLVPPLDDPKDLEGYEKAEFPASLVDIQAKQSDRKNGNTLAAETHAGVTDYDRGRGISILIDLLHGWCPYPKLERFTWSRIPVLTVTLLLLWTDCQSLLDHLLSRKAVPLQGQRLLGYVSILEEALRESDICKLFHISGLINPLDAHTKVKESRELEQFLSKGVLRTEPGLHGERAEARNAAAAELRAEISRREKLGLPVPKGVLAVLALLAEEDDEEEW